MATQILLADGDSQSRSALMWCLLKEGFWVEPVANGLDAATALENGHPDVAIIDLALPVFPGRRLIERMRADERLREVPVVAIARNAPPSAVPDNVVFLRRPFSPETMLRAVARALGMRASRFWSEGFLRFRQSTQGKNVGRS